MRQGRGKGRNTQRQGDWQGFPAAGEERVVYLLQDYAGNDDILDCKILKEVDLWAPQE